MTEAPAELAATRFRQAHEADWTRLGRLLDLVEKGSLRRLATDDILALPLLYRTTLSSLSLARETSLDRALIDYLEQLATRAYFIVYGVRSPAWRQLAGFFARSWPEAVAALWRETIVAALLLGAGTLVGYLLVSHDPAWFYGLIPGDLVGGRDPAASAASLKEMLYTEQKDWLAVFAAFLFTHNSQQAVMAFALGFAFGVPTALLLAFNGVIIGAFLAIYIPKGLGFALGGWLLIHGTTELFAIVLAGAAGFRIGMAVAFPGDASRLDALVAAGRSASVAMLGVIVMLAIAGLLEGIGRQSVTSDLARYAIAAAMLTGWLCYFYLPRRHGAQD